MLLICPDCKNKNAHRKVYSAEKTDPGKSFCAQRENFQANAARRSFVIFYYGVRVFTMDSKLLHKQKRDGWADKAKILLASVVYSASTI